jgi:hypothetical protein
MTDFLNEIDDDDRAEGLENYPMSFIRDLIEKRPVTAEFDVYRFVTDNPFSFGPLGQSTRIGRWARFLGGEAQIGQSGTQVPLPEQYGIIIGDNFDRIVLSFEGTYLGWLNPEDYEVLETYGGAEEGSTIQ